MTENAPVPYPSAGFAYPVARPVPAFPQAAQAQQVAEPIAVETPMAQPEAEVFSTETQLAPQKFFPLVPTQSSKFVSEQPIVEAPNVEPIVEPSYEPAQLESPFDISSSLTREPQTNSIVLDQIPDALTDGDIFTDAGQILNTGSIELPTLTGEVTIVSDSPEADQADLLDSASVTISSVAPVRAPSVINSKAQLGVLPTKRRKNQGQLMAMLTLAIMIVTVGTLYAMAAITGFIK
jgi:hypothetical protein